MLAAVRGVFRNGKVELSEIPGAAADGSPVVVTFLSNPEIDLRAFGIGEEQAAELRCRLMAFAHDWDSPEMDIYDRYDAVKAGC